MRSEIVSIGSELLLGQIIDTNAAFIARHLASIGLDLFHKVTVGDNLGRVAETLRTALGRAEVVITTGGLGPTADDVTREAVALATGRRLVFVSELLGDIEAFFRARGFPLSPSNRKQAYIPEGAHPVRNPVGTAPCFIVEAGGRSLVSLPGVPREMEHLLLGRVLPYLRERHRLQEVIVSRLVRVAGLGESRVGEILGDFMAEGTNPTVGTLAHPGQVDVRIAAKGGDEAQARALIAPVETEVRRRLGDVVFGIDGETLEGVVANGLLGRGWSLSLLEVGTGGLVVERLTAAPGMGDRIQAIVTAGAERARRLGLLGVEGVDPAEAVRRWGRTDLGAAVVMGAAQGEDVRRVYPTTISVAGQEGPSLTVREHRLGGDLGQVRLRARVLALDGIRRVLVPGGP